MLVDVAGIFQECFDVAPSESSIRAGAKNAAEAAGPVIHSTKVPTSGFMGYNEIHVRVSGRNGRGSLRPAVQPARLLELFVFVKRI